MTASFVFAFHRDADNVGDRESSPARFISIPNSGMYRLDDVLPAADTLILGGGAIFGGIKKLVSLGAHRNYRRILTWGISLPERSAWESVRLVSQSVDVMSTRDYDWRDSFEFVPCASCLSPVFDEVPAPINDVVLYLHRKKTPAGVFTDSVFPVMNNDAASLRSALMFIGSGDVVVTNSYHGVFWAQMLGRRVVCIPYGRKFFGFQDHPTYAEYGNWRQKIRTAARAPSRIEEYRNINFDYFERAVAND